MLTIEWASLVVQMVKNLPAMQETWVQSLSGEDPLEKGMATHSSILAWKIPQTEEPGRLSSMVLKRAGHNWVTNTSIINHRMDRRLCVTGSLRRSPETVTALFANWPYSNIKLKVKKKKIQIVLWIKSPNRV